VDWNELVSPLMVEISPMMAVLFSIYIAFCTLAMMNVVTGIFVENVLISARADKDHYLVSNARDIFKSLDGGVNESPDTSCPDGTASLSADDERAPSAGSAEVKSTSTAFKKQPSAVNGHFSIRRASRNSASSGVRAFAQPTTSPHPSPSFAPPDENSVLKGDRSVEFGGMPRASMAAPPRRMSNVEQWTPAMQMNRHPVQTWSFKGAWAELRELDDVAVFSPMLRIILNYGQILALLTFVDSGALARSTAGQIMSSFNFLEVFSFQFFVDYFETIDCGLGTTVGGKTAITMLLPVFLIALVGLVVLVWKVFTPQVGLAEFTRASMFGCMIMYTSVITSVLSNLTPQTVNGETYLKRDTSVVYDSRIGLMVGSAIYAFVYGLVLPMLLERQFYLGAIKGDPPDDVQRKTKTQFGFITKGYLKYFYWWEMVVLVRRLLCVLAVVASTDPLIQTCFMSAIIIVFMALHSAAAPLNMGFLNLFEYVNLFCLLASVFATLVGHMSAQQDDDGLHSSVALLTEFAAVVFLTAQVVFILVTVFIVACLLHSIKHKLAAWAAMSATLPAMLFKLLVRGGTAV